jgi:hypothetical protein
LRLLARQTVLPKEVIVVGANESDIGAAGRFDGGFGVRVVLSEKQGLTAQRNAGLSHLLDARGRATHGDFFVVFFDDDFRPAVDWLERCREIFAARADVVGLTGRVLADGAHGESLTETEAELYLSGERPPRPHWAGGTVDAEIRCAYGCNMAFRDRVVARCRFDENLPLYGWQEDQDFTSRARAHGVVVYRPACRGVHLGTRAGRVSGVRFGYSQVANPLYLMRKGTMGLRKGSLFLLKATLANTIKTILGSERADYPGRLRGNTFALADLMRLRCHPLRVLDLA